MELFWNSLENAPSSIVFYLEIKVEVEVGVHDIRSRFTPRLQSKSYRMNNKLIFIFFFSIFVRVLFSVLTVSDKNKSFFFDFMALNFVSMYTLASVEGGPERLGGNFFFR